MRRSPTWPRRFRERDSNPTHLWGQSPASCLLDDPGASKNRCLHALAHSSSSLSVVGAGPRGLSLPLGLRLPTGLSLEPGPRTPCGTVRVLPSSARVHPDSPSRTRTSDRLPPGGLAEQQRRPSGRPHRSTGCYATELGHEPSVLRRGVAQRPLRKSMRRPRCIRIMDAIDRFVADVWLVFSHGSKERAASCGAALNQVRRLSWSARLLAEGLLRPKRRLIAMRPGGFERCRDTKLHWIHNIHYRTRTCNTFSQIHLAPTTRPTYRTTPPCAVFPADGQTRVRARGRGTPVARRGGRVPRRCRRRPIPCPEPVLVREHLIPGCLTTPELYRAFARSQTHGCGRKRFG